jgi:organic hydroperoxide reductase OsmC/OhrA
MAAMTSINYRPQTVTSIGGLDGIVRSADGLIDLQVTLPKETGGRGGNPNLEMLFVAGYAACFHSAVKRVTHSASDARMTTTPAVAYSASRLD